MVGKRLVKRHAMLHSAALVAVVLAFAVFFRLDARKRQKEKVTLDLAGKRKEKTKKRTHTHVAVPLSRSLVVLFTFFVR